MKMKKYEITIEVAELGKVKHVTRAMSMDAAKAKTQAAHPKGQIIAFQEVRA